MGGGTFDVTVLSLRNDRIDVKASSGEGHLGGEDFDNILVDYCLKEIKEKTDIDLSNNAKAMRKLRTECEKQKCALSADINAIIPIDNIGDDEDFGVEITRAKFEDICKDLFLKCIEHV